MLAVTDLTYRIAGRTLFDRASVVVPAKAKAGLVGRNGTGKTTLFRLLTGEIAPESGTISLPARARIGRVAQEAPGTEESLLGFVLKADTERAALLAEAETAADPARIAEIHVRLADIGAHSAEARAGAILHGLGFDAEAQQQPCRAFSGGWRMRVALAAVLFAEPDLLLLDEPTNYLDLEGTLWLETYVARYPHTVLLISHDRDLLNRAVSSIVHLEGGRLTTWRGGYDQFARQKREQAVLQAKAQEKQEARRKHLQAFVDRFRAKATKARQAQSRLKMLEKMETIADVFHDDVPPITIPDPVLRAASPILHFERVAVGYQPGRPVLKGIDLRIDTDDRIALLGANGNGKSTFAKLVAGKLAPESGTLTRAPKLSVAYFAQHQLDELRPADSAVAHVRRLMPDAPEARVRSRVAQMGLSTDKMDTPAGELSGGERARLLIGLATFHGPSLLILDEPTNHLDIEARESLVAALNAFEGAILLISHDRHLVEATADRLWLVAEGGVRSYDGDMEDYRKLVLAGRSGEQRAEAAPSGPSAADRRRLAAERRARAAPLKKKIDASEKAMDRLVARIAEIDAALADPALYARDASRATALAKERAEAARSKDAEEEAWLAMTAEYEEAMTAEA